MFFFLRKKTLFLFLGDRILRDLTIIINFAVICETIYVTFVTILVFGASVFLPWVGNHDRRGPRRPPKGLPQSADSVGPLQRHPVRILLPRNGHEHVQVRTNLNHLLILILSINFKLLSRICVLAACWRVERRLPWLKWKTHSEATFAAAPVIGRSWTLLKQWPRTLLLNSRPPALILRRVFYIFGLGTRI